MSSTLPVYIGFDDRQLISYSVAQMSVVRRAVSKPVAVHPLVLSALPIQRQGLTPFTYSRFLVPFLQDFSGWAVFMDGDVIAQCDVAELFALADPEHAVQCVDTTPKYERSAVLLFNCAHEDNRVLTPDFVESTKEPLHVLGWTRKIGFLPRRFQHIVGYDRPPEEAPAIIHYTAGVPAYPETGDCEYAAEWVAEYQAANSTIPWGALMGRSNHATVVNGKPMPRYKAAQLEAARRGEHAGAGA